MFLHLSVSHSVHRGVSSTGPGGCLPGGVSRPGPGRLPGGCPGPGWGGCPGPGGCIPRCTEADTPPPQQTATAADGTHPTGMHSCSNINTPHFIFFCEHRSLLQNNKFVNRV